MGGRDDAPTPAADFREQGRGGIWVCKRVGGGFSIQEAVGRGGGGQEGAEPAAAAAAAAAGIDSIVLLPLRGVFAFLLLFWLVVMRLRLLHVRLSVLAVCCACEGAD
jgi:hypothetical protein